MDTHPGPVRDKALQLEDEWLRMLATAVRDGQAEGSIDPTEDPDQLAFELNSYLLLANARFVAMQDSEPVRRARRAIESRISAAAPRA